MEARGYNGDITIYGDVRRPPVLELAAVIVMLAVVITYALVVAYGVVPI
jgi:cobalt/nickel transport system permease protein